MVWANGSTQLNAYTGTGAAGRLMFSNHSTKGGTRYVYLGDRLIAEHNNQTGVSYSHTDALGSPVARTNGAGQIIGSRTRYEPYGATAAGDVPQGIGFTGHVNDPDTGLVYMQQRYYDPVAGRFLSVDPVVTNAVDGSFFGRYHYANNNPYAFTDPSGMEPECSASCMRLRVASDARSLGMSALSAVDSFFAGGFGAQSIQAARQGNWVGSGGYAVAAGVTIAATVATGGVSGVVRVAAAKGVPLLRQGYVDAVSDLGNMVGSMRASGASTESIARALHAKRRAIGEQFKALPPADKLGQIYERNLQKYGDKLGPSVDWLRAQGKSWDQIIESATRTGGKDLSF